MLLLSSSIVGPLLICPLIMQGRFGGWPPKIWGPNPLLVGGWGVRYRALEHLDALLIRARVRVPAEPGKSHPPPSKKGILGVCTCYCTSL